MEPWTESSASPGSPSVNSDLSSLESLEGAVQASVAPSSRRGTR
jgi:hypothetical protein